MVAEQLIQDVAGSSLTQIRFIAATGFSPADSGTDWTIGTPTDVDLTLSGVANGAGQQSAKFDFGAVRAPFYTPRGCVDFTGETPPGSNGRIDYYFAPSTNATTGDGNVAGNSGTDAVCPTGALGSITLAEFLTMCDIIGSLFTHDGAVVQNGLVVPSLFVPSSRWGQLIVVNNSGFANFEADNVEAHQVLDPFVPESQ